MYDEQEIINVAKMLSIDMIDEAQSGHPGIALDIAPTIYTLFTNHLNINPNDPMWINRDRFVLSAGHGSAILYAMLYIAGYNITLKDLKEFRKLNSKTPGEPDVNITPGVDVSTGPLGQGIANAVGIALAERYLRNYENNTIIDYYTYCLCGDGCLMEGISYEALAFAAVQRLNKLIILYDKNNISLDGDISVVSNEDIIKRFEALNFNVLSVEDGNNIQLINNAIDEAKKSDMPSIIIINTIIGNGSSMEGTAKVHGTPLTKDDIQNLRDKFNFKNSFYYNKELIKKVRNKIDKRVKKVYQEWQINKESESKKKENKINKLLNLLEENKLEINMDCYLQKISDNFCEDMRITNNNIINYIANETDFFIGGCADVSGSTKLKINNSEVLNWNNVKGKNINFGVREHAMGAILNGMALNNMRVFGSTYLVFEDYLRPALRMSAMMDLPVTYIFYSSTMNKEGPSHEAIEQKANLRLVPNINTFTPCDIVELIGCWKYIMKNHKTNVIIIETEKTNKIPNTNINLIDKGAYILQQEREKIDAIIISTGSELKIAIQIQKDLKMEGFDLRVVSMPCINLFLKQDSEYKLKVLPKKIKTFVIEAGNTLIWNTFATDNDYIIGINDFGKSGDKREVLEDMGMGYEEIKNKIKLML